MSRPAEPGHIADVIGILHASRRRICPDISALTVVDDCPLTDREFDAL